MTATMQEFATVVVEVTCHELDDARKKIEHCLKQLEDEQICWRPAPSMNSIANLVLHLCGNLRQWIASGIGGAADTRNRPQEFADHGPITRNELLDRLSEAVGCATETLRNTPRANLLKVRRVQGFEVSGIGVMLHSVSHFRGHTQEIVHMTRIQLGDRYEFDFVPSTPEQGAK